jgi:GNAT superfamily N-acetyltransferase
MNLEIRPITSDEWRLWRSLRLRAVEESPDAFRGTLPHESAEAGSWWRGLIERATDRGRGLLLVAEVESDPVGMLFGRLDAESELLEVGSIWVDPDVRRQGIGSSLIETAVRWAREAGASRGAVWITEGNAAALELCAGQGFAATGDTEALREGSDRTVMKMVAQL